MIHELRIYTATNGRMNDLIARFRDHTMALFEKHGIQNVAYWRNSIGGHNDELWYILAFEDANQRAQAWAAFGSDPDWNKARSESEANGPLVDHIENRLITMTDFSPLQ